MVVLLSILGYLIVGLVVGRLYFVFGLQEEFDDEELDTFVIILHILFWPIAIIIWSLFGLGWVCFKIVTDPSSLIKIPARYRRKK